MSSAGATYCPDGRFCSAGSCDVYCERYPELIAERYKQLTDAEQLMGQYIDRIATLERELAEVRKERDQLLDRLTCMCGSYVDQHTQGDGHLPVSMYDYALDEARAELREANQLLRSAHAVAERKGENTHWPGLLKSLKELLDRHHELRLWYEEANGEAYSSAEEIAGLRAELKRTKSEKRELRGRLSALVTLKDYRQHHGKDDFYRVQKPVVWSEAIETLEAISDD